MQLLSCVLVVCVAVVIQLPGQTAATPSPIILLPGLMGSRLKVLDNNPRCYTGNKYKNLWTGPRLLCKCAVSELKLYYDERSHSFRNNSGVSIEVPGFGGTKEVEHLNNGIKWGDFRLFRYPYYSRFVEYFVERGYKRGVSIRAAPYDWRLAADELEKRGYFHQLKSLIEDTYNKNGRTKVTLVVHSMGGPVSLHFLTSFINQDWKDKYIHAYVPLAGAWNGGVKALQAVISSFEFPAVEAIKTLLSSFSRDLDDAWEDLRKPIDNFFVPVARTLESLPWLFPKASVYGNQVLISTPSKNYTASDYEELFKAVDYKNGFDFFQGTQQLLQGYPAPNVPTYCFYGVGVSTAKNCTYNRDFEPGVRTTSWVPTKVGLGDGDGTVNIESSEVCLQWLNMKDFHTEAFRGVDHTKILSDQRILENIAEIVGASEPKVNLIAQSLINLFED